MAESMKGLRRSHRCTELSNRNIGETDCYGLGTEKQEQRWNNIC